MSFVGVLAVALAGSLLLSGLAARTPLSLTVLFLGVGLAAGPAGTGILQISFGTAAQAADAVLFTVLLTDGQHAPLSVLRDGWRNPLRVLSVGMVGTAVVVGLLASLLTGLPLALVTTGVLVSVVAHASTDVLVANALRRTSAA